MESVAFREIEETPSRENVQCCDVQEGAEDEGQEGSEEEQHSVSW